MKKDTVSSFTNTTRLSLTFKIGGIFLCSFVIFIAVILPLSVYTVDSTAHTAVHNIVTKQLQSSLNMGGGISSYFIRRFKSGKGCFIRQRKPR